MNYKKIIKNKELRLKLLKLFNFVPSNVMLKFQYKVKMNRKLNLKNPQRWTEKIQWYKMYYKNPLLTQCADKYTVREYIKSKNLEEILVKLYGVYKSASEINYEKLPDKFVIKTTNGSGTNIICQEKHTLNINKVNKSLEEWINRDNYSVGREWSYKNIEPRIIIEEFLEDESNQFDGINDYKFLCFNGKVHYVILDVDRHIGHKRNIYDSEWNFIDVNTDCPNFGDTVPIPNGFNEMKKVAEKLAKDFPFVRVDLYWVNEKVYFGELTFYPWTGYVQFTPDEFDFKLGELFKSENIQSERTGNDQ